MAFFDDKQVAALRAKLDGDAVKTRKQGGTKLSYLEGYTAIENANRIFGFGSWQGRILSMLKVDESIVKKKNDDGTVREGWYIAYTAEYEVTVWGADRSHLVTFTDIGFGSGTSYQSVGDATESATKEATTDAMKRTLRNFGNQFGLALYDKDQRNVDRGEFDPLPLIERIAALPQATPADVVEAMRCASRDELVALGTAIKARGNGKATERVTA
jgi:DNA repair and recombination protein RAD52